MTNSAGLTLFQIGVRRRYNPAAAPPGTRFLPIHQATEGYEFMPPGWCGGCDACGYTASWVCEVCSYDQRGRPIEPVPMVHCRARKE